MYTSSLTGTFCGYASINPWGVRQQLEPRSWQGAARAALQGPGDAV